MAPCPLGPYILGVDFDLCLSEGLFVLLCLFHLLSHHSLPCIALNEVAVAVALDSVMEFDPIVASHPMNCWHTFDLDTCCVSRYLAPPPGVTDPNKSPTIDHSLDSTSRSP